MITYKILGQSNPSATTLTDLYTVPALTQAVCSTLVVCNRSATPTSFRYSVAPAGAADSPEQYNAFDIPINGNESQPITIGMTLGPADVVRVYATLATLSFNLFGSEIS